MTTEVTVRPGSRWAAVAIWATAWVVTGAALLMAWWFDLPRRPPEVFLSPAPQAIRNTAFAVDVAAAFVYAPVSALIISRRPHPVGIVLAMLSIGSALAAFGLRYGQLAAVHDLPWEGFVTFLGGWAFVPGTFIMASLPLLVRHDRLPWLDRGVVTTTVVAGIAATIASMTQRSRVPHLENPWAVSNETYQAALAPAYGLVSAVALLAALVTCAILVVRRWSGPAAPGLTWLLVGHVFLTISYIAMATPEGANPPTWLVSFALVAPVVGHVVQPAGVLVVILGQSLWGVAFVVSRAIVWALLSAGGVVAYLTGVAVMSVFVPGASDELVVVVALLIAAGALPVRHILQRAVDELVYGRGADPREAYSGLRERLDEQRAVTEGLRLMCGELQRSLRLGHVAVRARDTGRVVASAGSPGGEIVASEVTVGAEVVADLEVAARPGERLDARTTELVDGATGFLAAAWQLMESTRLLEDTRNELVEERAGVRRAVRRDLHDGLGPALTGAGFALAAADRLVESDPRRAVRILHETADGLDRAVADVEALVARIGGGRRDVVDVVADLESLAERFSTPVTSVVVSGRLAVPATASAADAIGLIAAEAVSNAVRHAGASRVEIRLSDTDGRMVLVVSDDGRGIPAVPSRGVGMASMRERAEELGGTMRVETSNAGTDLHIELPAAAQEDPDHGA